MLILCLNAAAVLLTCCCTTTCMSRSHGFLSVTGDPQAFSCRTLLLACYKLHPSVEGLKDFLLLSCLCVNRMLMSYKGSMAKMSKCLLPGASKNMVGALKVV